MTPKDYETRIIALIKNRNFNEAYDVVTEALTIYPVNTFFLKNEIFVLARLNRTKQARQRAEEKVDVLKNDAFFLKTYLSILEKEKALEDLDHLLEKTVFPSGLYNEVFCVFLCRLAGRVFSKQKAEDLLERCILRFPESGMLKDLREKSGGEGTIENKYKDYKEKFKGRKTGDAIAEIEKIKTLPGYSEDFDLHVYLAELYKKAGEYEKAIEAYRHILSFKDNDFTRKMLGYAYYKMVDNDNALVYLKDAFFKDPRDHFLYSTIYKIFEAKADYEGFEKLINEVLGVNPWAKHLFGILRRAKKWGKTQ